MTLLTLLFGLFGDCLLSVLVGLIGSHRKIGFGWAFLASLFFTPFIGLLITLLSDSLPGEDQRWGCLGTLIALLGVACLVIFLLALLGVLTLAVA